AADDHHVARIGVGVQRRVRDHLVVEEVVARGQHHRAVDQHQVAPVGRLVDLDLLERRLHLVELAHDPEPDRGTGRLELLVHPGGLGHRGLAGGGGGRGIVRDPSTAQRLECAPGPFPPPQKDAPMAAWSPDQARKTYSIPHWSEGYFDVDGGHMVVRPRGAGGPAIPLPEVVDAARASGAKLPLLLRFPDILRDRLGRLQAAFAQAQEELDYAGGYAAVYPIKVNQHAGVAGVLAAKNGEGFGLEAGSKPELMAVMALSRPGGLVVCNGYKDREY